MALFTSISRHMAKDYLLRYAHARQGRASIPLKACARFRLKGTLSRWWQEMRVISSIDPCVLICLMARKQHPSFLKSPFQLKITASVRERPLRATCAIIGASTLPAPAVCEQKLLFVTERGLIDLFCFLEALKLFMLWGLFRRLSFTTVVPYLINEGEWSH